MEATPSALAAVELMFRKFAAVLTANPADPPDLHFVIAEAPAPGSPQLSELPPIGAVRPDLQRKECLNRDYPLDVIPTLPAVRILYYGEARWLRRFQDLAREAAVTFRSHDPDIEGFVTRATWEAEPFFMPNLWPRLARDIIEMSGSKGAMRRWRWGTDRAMLLVPYDDAELKAWVEASRERGGVTGPAPSKCVNVTTFSHNAFETSCAALDWSAYQIGHKLKLTDSDRTRPVSAGDTPAPRRPKKRRESIVAMIRAYRENGLWGVTPRSIAKRCEIAESTFYKDLKNSTVKLEWDRYLRESIGKRPASPDDL